MASWLDYLSCFQCVKGNKFESDSQQLMGIRIPELGCFQCVKGNKFESDSQLHDTQVVNDSAVSNVSKVINLKAIHNYLQVHHGRRRSCFQCVKGNKFESDSQQSLIENNSPLAVSNVSKVINLKAIHNMFNTPFGIGKAVSNVSKVINLKAIHNSLLQRHECLFSLQFGEFTLLKFGDSKLLITHRAH